jgi:peptide deformylase
VSYVRAIVTDHDRLHKPSLPVSRSDFRSPSFRSMVDDMAVTLRQSGGIGISAIQIGERKRVCVIRYEQGFIALCNPKIEASPDREWMDEACLSLPNFRCEVYRPKNVTVTGKGLTGRVMRLQITGLLAQCICHELDHFNGQLINDQQTAHRNARIVDNNGNARLHIA